MLADDTDYFKVTAHARLKLKKDTALALQCFVRKDDREKPPTCSTRTDASTGESGSDNKEACGKVKQKHIAHIADTKQGEVFTMAWCTRQSLFKKLWIYQKAQPP